MAEFTLAERLRTAHVTRWQIIRTARQQTLAEHLYLVRVLTVAMCEAASFDKMSSVVAENWALEHDVPEVKTGDLATPVKAAMREAVPHDDPIRRIELSYSDSYRILYNQVKNDFPHVRTLVKMADTLEAVMFLDVEGIGVHAKIVQHDLWMSLLVMLDQAGHTHPEYSWGKVYDLARKHTGA